MKQLIPIIRILFLPCGKLCGKFPVEAFGKFCEIVQYTDNFTLHRQGRDGELKRCKLFHINRGKISLIQVRLAIFIESKAIIENKHHINAIFELVFKRQIREPLICQRWHFYQCVLTYCGRSGNDN